MLSFYLPLLIIVIASTGLMISVSVTFTRMWKRTSHQRLLLLSPRIAPSNAVEGDLAIGTRPPTGEGSSRPSQQPDPVLLSQKKDKHGNRNVEITLSIAAFCLLLNSIMAVLFALKARRLGHGSTDKALYDNWLSCVFSHFDGVGDESWIGICGKQAAPYNTASFTSLNNVASFLIPGQSIAVSITFFRIFWEPIQFCCTDEITEDREIARILEIRKERGQNY
jgi:hypothetical protein